MAKGAEMRDDSWKEEMEVLMKWTRENWEKTGKRAKASGVTGSLSLGQFKNEQAQQKKVA